MTIKKSFVKIVDLLEANKNKKVSSIMDQILELASGKANTDNSIKDADGNVLAVFCYYHKQWESVEDAEYGSKASNKSTGLNTMCKEGVANWSKQQRDATKAKADAIEAIAAGDLPIAEVIATMDSIETARTAITPREDEHGFADKADILAFLNAEI